MRELLYTARHIGIRIRIFKDWYKLVFPINSLISKSQTLHLRNGLTVHVEDIFSSDVSVLMELFWSNPYHIERLKLPPDAIVVDIGANIGAFSLGIQQKFPNAHVVAFEPSPRNFTLLEKNLPTATLSQKAVTGLSGTTYLGGQGAHTALHVAESGTVQVQTLSLSDALQPLRHVDLLKMDIEGAEYEVFSNTTKETLQKVSMIIMEVHDLAKRKWFEDFFTGFGYEVEWYSPWILKASR